MSGPMKTLRLKWGVVLVVLAMCFIVSLPAAARETRRPRPVNHTEDGGIDEWPTSSKVAAISKLAPSESLCAVPLRRPRILSGRMENA
ncbi:MAG: hypothetical protein V2A71_05430 [Candidatus Eisenbacteria bacterium]